MKNRMPTGWVLAAIAVLVIIALLLVFDVF